METQTTNKSFVEVINSNKPVLVDFFSSCSIGAIILHGPHHSAKKSTSTGLLLLMTSAKLLLVV